MNEKFKTKIDQLPHLFDQLADSEPKKRTNLANLPQKGVYAFFERSRPMYVGRSNRMKNRIMEHGRPKSDRYNATFAFRLAIEKAEKKGIDVKKLHAELEKDPYFAEVFSKEKERVSQMQIRTVEINDSLEQTLFEIYASVAFNTKYNYFNVH